MRIAPLLAFTAACASRPYTLPMTSAGFADEDTGAALLTYLAQPDASPIVCDLHASGPHVSSYRPEIRNALAHGLVDGRIPPTLWRRCMDAALDTAPPADVVGIVDALLGAYRALLLDGAVQTNPALVERLQVVHRLYLERRAGVDASPKVRTQLVGEVRERLADRALGTVAAGFATELLATIDLERGLWNGAPVDLDVMDQLASEGNELTLTRFARRLPNADLRAAAMRRIIRVHIALSPFDEVRAAAAEVEERMARDGVNRLSLAEHPLLHAWFDDRVAPKRTVLVRQHVWQQAATLLGVAWGTKLSVLPELAFRNVLWAELDPISRPVTLCAAASALDPSPCIDAADVQLANPFTYLDRGGAFHFRDDVSVGELLPSVTAPDFTLPISLAGRPAVSLRWGFYFERPDNLVFSGGGGGGRGPDIEVRVEHPSAERYVFEVNGYTAIVQSADLGAFRVASYGGDGYDGSTGYSGSSGSSGSECSDGGNGGDGGPGGDGSDAGDGGDVHVVLACGALPCDEQLLASVIISAGGRGGSGGAGGSGGSGGSGGPARSPTTHTDSDGNTITDDPGCSAGSNGSNGSDGMRGSDGRNGYPGRVTFSYE